MRNEDMKLEETKLLRGEFVEYNYNDRFGVSIGHGIPSHLTMDFDLKDARKLLRELETMFEILDK